MIERKRNEIIEIAFGVDMYTTEDSALTAIAKQLGFQDKMIIDNDIVSEIYNSKSD